MSRRRLSDRCASDLEGEPQSSRLDHAVCDGRGAGAGRRQDGSRPVSARNAPSWKRRGWILPARRRPMARAGRARPITRRISWCIISITWRNSRITRCSMTACRCWARTALWWISRSEPGRGACLRQDRHLWRARSAQCRAYADRQRARRIHHHGGWAAPGVCFLCEPCRAETAERGFGFHHGGTGAGGIVRRALFASPAVMGAAVRRPFPPEGRCRRSPPWPARPRRSRGASG